MHASIFLFHRDLRINDNTGLLRALKESKTVYPVFIFDPSQLKPHRYRSAPGAAFMMQSLRELDEALRKKGGKLYCFHGDTAEVCTKLIGALSPIAIYSNRDYTPFAQKRDTALKAMCTKQGVAWYSCADALLHEPEEIAKDDGSAYTVYTPFYKKCLTRTVRPVETTRKTNYATKQLAHTVSIDAIQQTYNIKGAPQQRLSGGRAEAKRLLRKMKTLKRYATERDIPAKGGTSHLSAHNKFGTLSIRELYHAATKAHGKGSQFIKELYWRDFFTHIGYHFPHVFTGTFREKYNNIQWSRSKNKFEKWCLGQTGFPIVDAGMRELVQTGYMHNRVRMIVASFLVKDLHINWQWGERFFARHLTDYDPCVNNGSWQWAASTGCDAQPYFRIFNPWTQQKKFDPECIYIKTWVPELADCSFQTIHALYKKDDDRPPSYPAPIVDHAVERKHALALFEKIKKK